MENFIQMFVSGINPSVGPTEMLAMAGSLSVAVLWFAIVATFELAALKNNKVMKTKSRKRRSK